MVQEINNIQELKASYGIGAKSYSDFRPMHFILFGLMSVMANISFIFSVFTPFPLVFTYLIFGKNKGIQLSLAGIALHIVVVISGTIGDAPIFLASYTYSALIAYMLYEVFRRGIHPVKGMMVIGLTVFLSIMVMFGIGTLILSVPLVEFVTELIKSNSQVILERKTEFLAQGGEDALKFIERLEKPGVIAKSIIRAMPSYVFTISFCWVWVNLLILLKNYRRLMPLQGIKLKLGENVKRYFSESDLHSFRVPFNVVWPLIVTIVLTIFGDSIWGVDNNEILESILFCFALFYFFQGYGLFIDLLNYLKIGGIIRTMFIVLTIIFLHVPLAFAGLIDTWLDLRRFLKRKTEENENKGDFE